jgi:predicted transcriptional regulator
MPQNSPTEPITVRARKEMVTEIDVLASAMDRSRNYVVVRALEPYLEANAWQIERIKDGIAAAHEGRVVAADEVFSGMAAKHGWTR